MDRTSGEILSPFQGLGVDREYIYREFESLATGAEDERIYFNTQKGMDQLPVGNYSISHGSFTYGKEKPEGDSTSFQNVSAFAIKKDQTTTIELGKPEIKTQAVEQNKRYNQNERRIQLSSVTNEYATPRY